MISFSGVPSDVILTDFPFRSTGYILICPVSRLYCFKSRFSCLHWLPLIYVPIDSVWNPSDERILYHPSISFIPLPPTDIKITVTVSCRSSSHSSYSHILLWRGVCHLRCSIAVGCSLLHLSLWSYCRFDLIIRSRFTQFLDRRSLDRIGLVCRIHLCWLGGLIQC